MSTFGSLNTVRSGLYAAQRALDVIGRNVSNANTAGYTRQEVGFLAAEPGQVIHSAGRGISEVNVVRYRDEFLDRQYRQRSSSEAYYGANASSLTQVEQILGDVSSGGLRTALDAFYNSWDGLSLRPSDAAARTQVINAAEELLGLAKAAYNDLLQLRTSVDANIAAKVSDVNAAAKELASLNDAIMAATVEGRPVPDLEDRRDMLLDSLAKLAGISTARQTDGSVTVYIGAQPLVEKKTAHPLNATVGMEAGPPFQFITNFTWSNSGMAASFPGGELAALTELRSQTIPDYMEYLDNLVRTVATQVNAKHTEDLDADGSPDAVPFFTIGANWLDVNVNAAIKADPSLILAARTVPAQPGDGDRARSIAALRDAKVLTGAPVGTQTVTAAEYLRSVMTQIGLQVQQAVRRSETATQQTIQAENHRQSVSGVSLDDEMAKMIQHQQAYTAAARVMTAMDEMLEIMVNRVGLFGR